MKEPWEVFHEEFFRALQAQGEEVGAKEKVQEAVDTAREAVGYHLVDSLNCHPAEALKVVDRFKEVIVNNEVEEWREKLRHAWTDWDLKRSRQRR